MKRMFFLSAVLTILALMLTGCEKPEPPAPPAVFYTLSTSVIGEGSVSPDKLTGIIPGSSITIKITPGIGYSIYSVKINGVKVDDIQPSSSEVSYVIPNIDKNQEIVVDFVENDILLVSKLQPPFMLTRVGCYRLDNDSFVRYSNLTQEEKSWRIYHYYPSMDIEVINPDGSVFWKNKWSLKQGLYQQGSQILKKVNLTEKEFSFKTDKIWSEADNCYVYFIHTYERKTN